MKRYIGIAGAALVAIQFRAGVRFGVVAEKLDRKISQWNRDIVRRTGSGVFVVCTRLYVPPPALVGVLALGFILPIANVARPVAHPLPAALACLFLVVLPTMAIVMVLTRWSRHSLSVVNQGRRLWAIHLNALPRNSDSTKDKSLVGLDTELQELASFSRQAGVRAMSMKSPLLVNEASAQLLLRKLSRVFEKHGLLVSAELGDVKKVSPFSSGMLQALRPYQQGLKPERWPVDAKGHVLRRELKLQLSVVSQAQ